MNLLRLWIAFALLLPMILLGALVSPAGAVGLSAAENGEHVTVKVGEDVAIRLDANPASGYSWRLANVDPTILRQQGAYQFEENSNKIGLVALQVMHFQTLRPGSTFLTLLYRRAWDTDAEAIQTYTLTVEVVPK
jgi:inhibitor of cysteine peptidase